MKTKLNQAFAHSRFSKANLLVFALIFGAIGSYMWFHSSAATASANLWVDADGGICARQATPATYDTTTACGSLEAAFAASQPGDLVLVKCGAYPPQAFTTVRTSGNVTFRSETSRCASFEGSGGTAISFANKVGYLTLDNLTINGRIVGSSTVGTGNNNITITNNDIDVGKKISSQLIMYYVGSNLTISHNTIGPTCCGYNGGNGSSPEGIRIGKPGTENASCQTQACNVTISDNLMQYVVRDCGYWPSSGYGACPDTTCTNAVGCHADGIHIWGMDGGNITGNRFYGIECQGIYFENTNNSLNRNINVVNNAIATVTGGCGNKGIYLNATGGTNSGAAGYAGTWNVAFNSGDSQLMGPESCGSCLAGTKFIFAANNMVLDVTNSSGNNAGCGAAVWGLATATYQYNLWRQGGAGSTNAACGPNDVLANPPPAFVSEVSPPGTGNDLHLESGSSQAIDFVPASICTAITTTDMDGDSRPQGAACDAGADEYSTASTGGTPDTSPPTAPTNTAKTSSTTTSISLSWTASTDNVGVAGYHLYQDGTNTVNTTGTTATFSSLACGTSYSLAVQAYDGAGNNSSQVSINAATLACPATPPPPLGGGSTPPPTPKRGDCNGDGIVNIYDLSILLSHYNANYAQADFDTNAIVNVIDLSILLSNYGG